MTRYCLTRAEPSSLEEAFALALREDYVVASSYVHPTFVDVRSSGPEPMDIDTIESSGDRRRGSSDRSAARKERPMICYRCRKQGHRAAVCRAPAPVMGQAASLTTMALSRPPIQKTAGTSRCGRSQGRSRRLRFRLPITRDRVKNFRVVTPIPKAIDIDIKPQVTSEECNPPYRRVHKVRQGIYKNTRNRGTPSVSRSSGRRE